MTEQGAQYHDAPSFARTRRGLRLAYDGLCILFGGVHAGLLLCGLGAFSSPIITYAGVALILLSVIAGTMTTFTGQVMCLAVAKRTHANAFIQANIVLRVIWIVVLLVLAVAIIHLWQTRDADAAVSPFVLVLAIVCDVLGMACFWSFVAFARRLSLFFERHDLGYMASSLIVRGILLAIGHFIVLFLLAAMLLRGGSSAMGFASTAAVVLATIVANVFVFIQYAGLLRDLESAMAENE